jgi:outer membrane protein insertion porin family/translocation and assembly module TamA
VTSGWRGGAAALFALALLVLVAPVAAAQETVCDPGDVEVRRLRFAGNTTFPDDELARGIATTPSSWLRRTLGFLGTRRCMDRAALPLDVARLTLYYRKRGFFQAQVDTVVQSLGRTTVAVRFEVTEGPALRLDTLRVTGLDSVPDGDALIARLGLAEGMRFDQYAIDSARAVLVRRLRDDGYPYADVLREYRTHLPTRSAFLGLDVYPGVRSRIGEVTVGVTPREGTAQQVPTEVVQGLLGISPGTLYRESELVEAQRRIYQTDAYSHVDISIDTTSAAADSLVPLRLTLRETFMRTTRLGVGYGSLDCFRLSAEYTNVNFLRQARRLELNARMSKIGVGAPLDVAQGLCTRQVRGDVYSDTLNYYVGATMRTPRAFGVTLPTVTVYSETRSEFQAFLRSTPVALALSRGWPRGLGVPLTMSYNLEYGRTQAQPALFCAAFNLCTEEDRRRVEEYRRLAVLGASVVRDRSNDPVEPTAGTILRLDARHASRLVGADPLQQFNQLTGTAAWYQSVSDGVVLAARLRVGAVLGSSLRRAGDPSYVPPQERLYAGGPSTVRGFRQNELGPVAYLANQYADTVITLPGGETRRVFRATPDSGYGRVVPLGGNSVMVANLEARVRSPFLAELLQFTVFVDAGKLSRDIDFDLRRELRLTPGLGVRVASPVGPIRLDVGYNPYALAKGVAYYDAPLSGPLAPLYCVSPGNTHPIVDGSLGAGTVPVQDQTRGRCDATFQPERGGSLLRRLTLNFSIGQAF